MVRGWAVMFVVLGVGLGLLTPCFAEREVTEFQSVAKSVCTPLPSCALPQRGIISCPGGTEISTGLLPPWCSPEGRTKVRGRMLKYGIVQTTDERVAGEVTMLFNMNLDSSDLKGPFWGTYSIEPSDRGGWEGIVEGKAHSGTFWTYRVVLFGTGEFEGLWIKAAGVWQQGQGDRLEGRILDPGR